MDADEDPILNRFRAQARAWIEANLPASLKGMASLALVEGPAPAVDFDIWKARVAERGWGAPTWPKAYGGGGLTGAEAAILRQEMARAGAVNPMVAGTGLAMVGPTILEFGTEDQKRRHLPPIARGELIWCLGYSEPNAGSDLASLQTRCERQGDHWEVSGQKIWTSGADLADWCGALVRTDARGRKHDGISFVLLPMAQPGVETRPIKLIAGPSPFCETFFTAARVEDDDILGDLNKGWTVGKRLLQHERSSQTGANGLNPTKPPPLHEIAKQYLELDAEGRLTPYELRARLTAHLMHTRAHELTVSRLAAGPGAAANAASMLKNSATVVGQTRAELMIEILGARGLGWEGEAFTEDEIGAVRHWLYSKTMSIYGGAFEVQNNIVAKRILDLPDPGAPPGSSSAQDRGGLLMAVLPEEESMLRDQARAWCRARAPVAALRRMRDAQSPLGYDPALFAEMAAMGWAGAVIPEAYGGSGFSHLGLGLILEETGRNLTASPLLGSALAVAGALVLGGTPEQRQAHLPKIASGASIAALAVDEGAHHAPERVATTARPTDGGYVLSGAKTFVLDGMAADLLLVSARTSGELGDLAGVSLFLVPVEATGVTRSPWRLVDSRVAAQVDFAEVQVARDAVLGEAGAGWPLLEAVLDRARAGMAAEMLGSAQQAFEITLDYLRTRVQFGQPIGAFQALQHRAVKMFGELELSRSCVAAALSSLDRGGEDRAELCSLAKAQVGETLFLVSNEMVQMHGGVGVTDAHDAGLYLKRARAAEAAFGARAYHRERFARITGF